MNPQQLHRALEAFHALPEREQFIVLHRFALWLPAQFGIWSLSEIGQALGLSRERVRQLEVRALEKMSKATEGE